jgi:hypothetical protein
MIVTPLATHWNTEDHGEITEIRGDFYKFLLFFSARFASVLSLRASRLCA